MTKRRIGDYLSISRVKGLGQFVNASLSARELGEIMWPGHKMAMVNARAIIRELLLGEYIEIVPPLKAPDFGSCPAGPTGIQSPTSWDGPRGSDDRYRATKKAAEVIANPPWICKYCSLDTSGSMKRLWRYSCLGCSSGHQVCRFCRKQLLKATGDFPYVTKLRGCPGTVEITQRPAPKPKKKVSIETEVGDLI